MKNKLLAFALVAAIIVSAVPASASDEVTMTYRSAPDQAVLYLGDLVYGRDAVSLPPGEVTVTFPSNVITDSLIITENGARVPIIRFHGRQSVSVEDLLSSRAVPITEVQAQGITVTWPSEATETREVVLEYLMHGAGWQPVYDMTVLDEENVFFNFSAEITNSALYLEDAEVRLVSGIMVTGDMGVYTAQMTMAQNALGYENVGGGTTSQEQISAHHVYDIGRLTVAPGDVVRVAMASENLSARRIIAWDTAQGERTDVIYKIANTSEVPFAEGMVRTYQDGIYMGSDAIEWTPVGSEGSVTVAGMSDVRVRRQETVQELQQRSYEYFHEVTLEIGNYSGEDIDITVIDRWPRDATELSFSMEPERQPGNIFRWDVTIPAGSRETITYTFYTD